MNYKYRNYYGSSFFILLVIILFLVLSGCVSRKKYDAALQEIARLSVDSTFQEYNVADTVFNKNGLILSQEESLDNKTYKIDSLESLVYSLRRKLDSVKTRIATRQSDETKSDK